MIYTERRSVWTRYLDGITDGKWWECYPFGRNFWLGSWLGKYVIFTSIIKIQLIHQRSKGDSERNLLNHLGIASMRVQILVFCLNLKACQGLRHGKITWFEVLWSNDGFKLEKLRTQWKVLYPIPCLFLSWKYF